MKNRHLTAATISVAIGGLVTMIGGSALAEQEKRQLFGDSDSFAQQTTTPSAQRQNTEKFSPTSVAGSHVGGKAAIEPPIESMLKIETKPVVKAQAALIAPAFSATIGPKRLIETPIERMLKKEGSAQSTSFNNPKVQPGKVEWHPDFASACAASQRSGKPVLLFQMMGRLDDRFC